MRVRIPHQEQTLKQTKMYNWNIKQNKRGNGTAEIQVSIMVKELNETWAYDSESWITVFQNRLKEIPRTNGFNPEFSFKAMLICENVLEVWKMKTNGDKNYLMFTVSKNDSN